MNTESANLNRIKVPVPAGVETKPGDFAWDFDSDKLDGKRDNPTHYIYLILPGMKHMLAIEVRRGAPESQSKRVWGWDGNEDKPTLMPSILVPNEWHGWLRAGRLVSC